MFDEDGVDGAIGDDMIDVAMSDHGFDDPEGAFAGGDSVEFDIHRGNSTSVTGSG